MKKPAQIRCCLCIAGGSVSIFPNVIPSAPARFGSAPLEQGQRIRIGEVVVESYFRAVKQQRITGRIRRTLGHRGIDIGVVVEEQRAAFVKARVWRGCHTPNPVID